MSWCLTSGQGWSRDDDRWICFPMLTLVCSLSLLPLNAWKCKKAFISRSRNDKNMEKGLLQPVRKRALVGQGKGMKWLLLDYNIINFAIFFLTSLWSPIFDSFKSGQSREPPFCEFMKSRELITANQRKTEVTSAVKNYQNSLWSQHLLKVGSRDHPETEKKVAT